MQFGIVTNPTLRGKINLKNLSMSNRRTCLPVFRLEKQDQGFGRALGLDQRDQLGEHLRTLPMPSVMRLCPGNAPQKANAASHRQNLRLQEQLKNETLKTQEQIASECAAADPRFAHRTRRQRRAASTDMTPWQRSNRRTRH